MAESNRDGLSSRECNLLDLQSEKEGGKTEMERRDFGDEKQLEEVFEDSKTYLLLHRSKGIELSKENFKRLSAEMIEEKKDPDNEGVTMYKFYRPKEALSLEVIEELTGLTGERIRAVEVMLYIANKRNNERG
ncbi:hypothetical protein ES695_14375 [Candidatus Atribacteria bacterium 1244-E10-H5-B2]|nr:MAG: hypothetical protein ES695_14375 [Candidatus Atribacteria bacterium 1244-E10-H5-B2]